MTDVDKMATGDAVTPFFSQVELHAAHTALLKRQPVSGDLSDNTDATLVADVKTFIQRGRATGALINGDKDRWASQSIRDYWGTLLYRMGSSVETKLVGFDEAQAPALADDQCPYVGLEAFQEKNNDIFFGRHRFVQKILDKIRDSTSSRFVAVLGPSGSGKSSVIRAGLLHRLQREVASNGVDYLCLGPMVPGSAPLENLSRLLVRSGLGGRLSVAQQAQLLSSSSDALIKAVGVTGRPVALFVDQFEEIFTLCDDKLSRQAFADNLLGLAQATDRRHIVVIAMRSDYESRVVSLKGFYDAFKQGEERVTPLGASELREAIEQPAERVGLQFEEGIVDALVQDLLGEPAALPLLQFTLSKLWDNRTRNRVTWDSYRRLGGGRLALARSADAFYDQLKLIENQETAKRILLRMVRPGEELEVTSSRVRRKVLLEMGDNPERVLDVLARLESARLLRVSIGDTDDDVQVEIAHEALIRNWPQLVEWVEDARTQLGIRRRLETRASEWRQLGKGKAGLLDEVQLAEAEAWLKSSDARFYGYDDSITEFVKASRSALNAARRRERLVYGLAALGILLALTLGIKWILAVQGRAATFKADIADARNALPAHPDRSVASAEEASKFADNPQQRNELVSVLDNVVPLLENLRASRDISGALSATFSPDSRYVLITTRQGKAYVWPWQANGDPIALGNSQGQLNSAAFSSDRDSKYVITASDDGHASVWDRSRESQNQPLKTLFLGGPVKDARFVPDSNDDFVVTLAHDGVPRIWEWNHEDKPHDLVPDVAGIQVVAVGAGSKIALGGQDGKLTICQWKPNERVCEIKVSLNLHNDALRSLEFSEDGNFVATAGRDKRAFVVSSSGAKIELKAASDKPDANTGVIFNTAFSSDDPHWVITASYGGKVRVWNWRDFGITPNLVAEANSPVSGSNKAALSRGGREFATVSTDDVVHLWRPAGKTVLGVTQATQVAAFTGHVLPIESLAFSGDGRWILTASRDDTIRVWNATPSTGLNPPSDQSTGRGDCDSTGPLEPLIQKLKKVNSHALDAVAVSNDGRVLTASRDQTVRVWDLHDGELKETLFDSRGALDSATFSRHGDWILAVSANSNTHNVMLWPSKGSPVCFSYPLKVVHSELSDDNKVMLVQTSDGRVFLEDPFRSGSRTEVLLPERNKDSVRVVTKLSHDGSLIAEGDSKGRVWLWNTSLLFQNVRTPAAHPPLPGEGAIKGAINTLDFSATGDQLLFAGEDGIPRIWDLKKEKVESFGNDYYSINEAHFSPSGDSFVILDSQAEQPKVFFKAGNKAELPLVGHSDAVRDAAYSPNGLCLVTASDDGSARIWETSSGQTIEVLQGHSDRVVKAAFSPDGKTLVTGSVDGTARIYNINVCNSPKEMLKWARAWCTFGCETIEATLIAPFFRQYFENPCPCWCKPTKSQSIVKHGEPEEPGSVSASWQIRLRSSEILSTVPIPSFIGVALGC